jgi:hypothetical protein
MCVCLSICALYGWRSATYIPFDGFPISGSRGLLSLSFSSLFSFTTTYFFWHFVDIFPFFFLLFSLVFSPYFLSSCWLPRILFSLSHFDLCVVISVYRLLQIWCFSNVMLLVSVFFFSSSPKIFYYFSIGLVGGFLGSPHQSVFRMADSACATHAPSPLRLSNNPSPPPLVQHGRIHEWLHVVFNFFFSF